MKQLKAELLNEVVYPRNSICFPNHYNQSQTVDSIRLHLETEVCG